MAGHDTQDDFAKLARKKLAEKETHEKELARKKQEDAEKGKRKQMMVDEWPRAKDKLKSIISQAVAGEIDEGIVRISRFDATVHSSDSPPYEITPHDVTQVRVGLEEIRIGYASEDGLNTDNLTARATAHSGNNRAAFIYKFTNGKWYFLKNKVTKGQVIDPVDQEAEMVELTEDGVRQILFNLLRG